MAALSSKTGSSKTGSSKTGSSKTGLKGFFSSFTRPEIAFWSAASVLGLYFAFQPSKFYNHLPFASSVYADPLQHSSLPDCHQQTSQPNRYSREEIESIVDRFPVYRLGEDRTVLRAVLTRADKSKPLEEVFPSSLQYLLRLESESKKKHRHMVGSGSQSTQSQRDLSMTKTDQILATSDDYTNATSDEEREASMANARRLNRFYDSQRHADHSVPLVHSAPSVHSPDSASSPDPQPNPSQVYRSSGASRRRADLASQSIPPSDIANSPVAVGSVHDATQLLRNALLTEKISLIAYLNASHDLRASSLQNSGVPIEAISSLETFILKSPYFVNLYAQVRQSNSQDNPSPFDPFAYDELLKTIKAGRKALNSGLPSEFVPSVMENLQDLESLLGISSRSYEFVPDNFDFSDDDYNNKFTVMINKLGNRSLFYTNVPKPFKKVDTSRHFVRDYLKPSLLELGKSASGLLARFNESEFNDIAKKHLVKSKDNDTRRQQLEAQETSYASFLLRDFFYNWKRRVLPDRANNSGFGSVDEYSYFIESQALVRRFFHSVFLSPDLASVKPGIVSGKQYLTTCQDYVGGLNAMMDKTHECYSHATSVHSWLEQRAEIGFFNVTELVKAPFRIVGNLFDGRPDRAVRSAFRGYSAYWNSSRFFDALGGDFGAIAEFCIFDPLPTDPITAANQIISSARSIVDKDTPIQSRGLGLLSVYWNGVYIKNSVDLVDRLF